MEKGPAAHFGRAGWSYGWSYDQPPLTPLAEGLVFSPLFSPSPPFPQPRGWRARRPFMSIMAPMPN